MIAQDKLDLLSLYATRLRIHSLRATTAAGSGHPTTCLSAADLVAVLFFHAMRYDPRRPDHPGSDRFVLSKGHAAPLLYAAWAEAGLFPVEELLSLRQMGSPLEGHPTPRFSASPIATGSLGQGLGAGAGMAWAAKSDNLPSRVYVLLGDGETAEGSVWEAAAFASHYALDNLVAVVDINRLGQSRTTMLQHDTAAYAARFAAFGWHTLVVDGHDVGEIAEALDKAAAVRGQPTAILARTLKGKGVSFLEDAEGWHGKALGPADLERALQELPVRQRTPVSIPAPAGDGIRPVSPTTRPEPPSYLLGETIATREAFGAGLRKLAGADARVVALDADVKNSTFTEVMEQAYPGRFVQCYIAEQNMISVACGLGAAGRIPFASTFACFLTRAYDQIRMAAISGLNLKLMGSHAGASIGEDGASQMGLEDLAMMQAVAGSTVLYPADAVAMEQMVAMAASTSGIVYLRGTRMKTPVIYPNEEQFPVGGSKLLRCTKGDRLTIAAAGVTLFEALAAQDQLQQSGFPVRVIDLYSVKPLDRDGVLRAARETGDVVLVVEDHFAEGGLGSAVMAALAGEGIRVYHLAVRKVPTSGRPEEILSDVGISAAAIVRAALEIGRTVRKSVS